MHYGFDLQSKWKTVQEVFSFVNGFLVVEILNLGHQLGVELWWNVVFF